jgi:hypothetical protein
VTASTSAPPRSAPAIAKELERRRQRRAGLAERLDETKGRLEEVRNRHARELADGDGRRRGRSSEKTVLELSLQIESIANSIELLDTDLELLERESAARALEDAAATETAAIAAATHEILALDELVRWLIGEQLISAADGLQQALIEARHAQDAHDHLRRKAGMVKDGDFIVDQVEALTRRRGALLDLVAQCRRYLMMEQRT